MSLTRRPLYRRGKAIATRGMGCCVGPRDGPNMLGKRNSTFMAVCEYFGFLMVAESISTRFSAINRTVAARNRTEMGRWVDD